MQEGSPRPAAEESREGSAKESPGTPPQGHARWRASLRIAAAAALFLAPWFLYGPALQGEFVVDDIRFIVQNGAHLDRLDEPWVYFLDPSTNSVHGDGDIYRPLRTLSFAVDRRLSGDDPTGFHAHNFVLHGLVATLLFLLLRGTFRRDGPAWVAAALFVSHPLASEAVAWISSRADLQAGVLLLAALLAARRAENGGGLWIVPVTAALACFGKESAIVAPALYLVEHALRNGRFHKAALRSLLLLIGGGVAWFVVYVWVRSAGVHGQVPFYGGSFWSHLPYGLIGVAHQWRMSLLPWGGHHYQHEPALYHPATGAPLWLAIVGLAIVFTTAWITRRRAPFIAGGILWFSIALLPTANVLIPMRTVLAERFAYVPLMGVTFLVAHALAELRRRISLPVATAVTALSLAGLSAATLVRAADWRSSEALHRAALSRFPTSYSANLGLGSALELEDPDESARLYARAMELATDTESRLRAAYGLGHVFITRGHPAAAVQPLREVEEALTEKQVPLESIPYGAEARFELATALAQLRQLDQSADVLDRLIAAYGENARFLDARGELERVRLSPRAIDFYSRALELDPDYHPARIHRAVLMTNTPGWEMEGENELIEVLARDPGNPTAARLLEESRAKRRAERDE